jgi:glycosyltransferase involved in cell wall biosynthesis/predicted metal-dependent phosphoesterase TrpH
MTTVTRVDLHLHSRASTETGNWFLKNAVLPESYTDPEDAYRKAKGAGMDLITLTDHDTINGALEIAHHPDAFVSVEATTRFPEDGVPLHVLCWNIDEADFAIIDSARDSVYDLVEALDERGITYGLAHPLYRVGAVLTPWHVERCLLLFPIWEGRNGARSRDGNEVANRIASSATPEYLAKLAERHELAPRHPAVRSLTAGSDDHGLLDAAATFTETPWSAGVPEFLDHVRQGRTALQGQHGSTAALAHAMLGLAIKSASARGSCPIPGAVRPLVGDLLEHPLPPAAPDDESHDDLPDRISGDRTTRRAWRATYRLPEGPDRSHARLSVAATWAQRELMRRALEGAQTGSAIEDVGRSLLLMLGAIGLAAPYVASAGYHAAEARHARAIDRSFFGTGEGSHRCRHTLVLTDTFDEINGVAGTMRRLAERSGQLDLPITVVAHGDAPRQTRSLVRIPPLARLPVPAYGASDLSLGMPSLIDLLDVVESRGATAIHAATTGPMGLAGLLVAKATGLPFAVSHSTQLARYTLALTGDRLAAEAVRAASTWVYRNADAVFAPTSTIAEGLSAEGVLESRIRIFSRGTDTLRFGPTRRSWRMRRALARDRDAVIVLAVARLSAEKGLDRLIDAVELLQGEGLRVRLAIVGDGPGRPALERRVRGRSHRLMGSMTGDRLAAAYASADLFCLPSDTETLGQVVLEAQASGLPAVVPAGSALAEQVVDGVTGLVAASSGAEQVADALRPLIVDATLRRRLSRGARELMLTRPTWDDVFIGLARDHDEIVEADDSVGRLLLRHPIESAVL